MRRSRMIWIGCLVLFFAGVMRLAGFQAAERSQLPATYIPPGKQMFKEYCAACHGPDARGRGPVTPAMTKHAADLTTLAKRHSGAFPREYVSNVLRFGSALSSHGSSDMPVWGPLFQSLDNYNDASVRQRIKNLCDYLESIQEK